MFRFDIYIWNNVYHAIRAHQGHSARGIGRNIVPEAMGWALVPFWTEVPFLYHLTKRRIGIDIATVGLRPGGALDAASEGARFHCYCAGRNPYDLDAARHADHPLVRPYEEELRGSKAAEMVVISTKLLFELMPSTRVWSTKTHAFLLGGPVPKECTLQVHSRARDPSLEPQVIWSRARDTAPYYQIRPPGFTSPEDHP